MRNVIRLPALLLLCLALSGCATVREVPEKARVACDLYQQVRPDVIKARAWAVEHWAEIPEHIKPTLIKLDSYLPALDRAGQMACSVGSLENVSMDWEDVLTTVIKGAALAAELKQRGAF